MSAPTTFGLPISPAAAIGPIFAAPIVLAVLAILMAVLP